MGRHTVFRDRRKKTIPLENEELPLVVGYTGIKADTGPLVRQVAEFRQSYPDITNSVFDVIDKITDKAKLVLNKDSSNLSRLGKLMDLNQGLLDSLGVNTVELSRLIFAAREGGAKGAKLSGAGGGDCMIALSEKKDINKAEKAINNAGGQIIPIKNNAEGVRREN